MPFQSWPLWVHVVSDVLDLVSTVVWLMDTGLVDSSLNPSGKLEDDGAAVKCLAMLMTAGILVPIFGGFVDDEIGVSSGCFVGDHVGFVLGFQARIWRREKRRKRTCAYLCLFSGCVEDAPWQL